MNNYIRLMEECNQDRDKIIDFDIKKHIIPKNIKGIMFKNKFYTKSECDEILIKKEHKTVEKRIKELEKILLEQENFCLGKERTIIDIN